MTRQAAQRVLLGYRPGRDGEDPEIREALALAEQDPELGRWLAAYLDEQAQIRTRLRQIQPPADLKARLLAPSRILRPRPWWRQPVWMSAAAAAVLFLAGIVLLYRPAPTANRFALYQSRMVGTALRQYRMDIVSSDMQQVRQFMAQRGAPADYELPADLQRLQLSGGGFLRWRDNPVAMVCFDRGNKEMYYLFVMRASAMKDPPPATPERRRINNLETASWTRGDKTYFLTAPAGAEVGDLHP